MNKSPDKTSRRQQILECLARMLEASPGERITTAALAKEVGVSEAALYRHFPSKSKMFEGLIEFIEETIFSRITLILSEEKSALKRCEKTLSLLLTFAERNPGLTRLLTGDALTGETERLRVRIAQFFDRIESTLRQCLRTSASGSDTPTVHAQVQASVLTSFALGRLQRFARSGFRRNPTEHLDASLALMLH